MSNDGDIPLLIKVGSGNQSDKKMFSERIKEYQKNINQENKDITYIADSALYTAENLQKLKQIKRGAGNAVEHFCLVNHNSNN